MRSGYLRLTIELILLLIVLFFQHKTRGKLYNISHFLSRQMKREENTGSSSTDSTYISLTGLRIKKLEWKST